MNEFSTSICINEQEHYQDTWVFGLKLLQKTEFELLNCQVVFYRGNKGRQSEYLMFKYFSEENSEKEARDNIEMTIGLLSYLVGFPLEDYGHINKKVNIEKRLLTKNKSFKKIENISLINEKILRFRKTKEMFFNNIKLINRAQHYQYIHGTNEDSFLNYFKIIENIAKFVRKNNENRKKNNKYNDKDTSDYNEEINSIVDNFLNFYYEIKYPHSKIENITKDLKFKIIKVGKDDIFFTIANFFVEHNIVVDSEDLYRAIKIRNKIAHGNYVEENELEDVYNFIIPLAYESISREFLNLKYSEIYIDGIAEPYGSIWLKIK